MNDVGATKGRTFYLLDVSERRVPMMRQQSNLRYASYAGYQAVELPYKGDNIAMTFLLPDGGKFREFEESLSGDSGEAILAGLDNEVVRLTIPKFEMHLAFSLSDTLSAIGIPDAFNDEAADLSGMDGQFCQQSGDVCLHISNVLHKAFISVDEEGTEVAASTAVSVGLTTEVEVKPEAIELAVDRPSMFIMHHQATGATLFVGRVLEP